MCSQTPFTRSKTATQRSSLFPMLSLLPFVLFAVQASALPGNLPRGDQSACGVRGYDNVQAFDYITKKSLANVEKCGARCAKNPDCLSFAISSSACLLYTVDVSDNVDTDSSSKYRFYDRGCVASPAASSRPKTTRAGSSKTRSAQPAPSNGGGPASCGLVGYDKGKPEAFYSSSKRSQATVAGCAALCKTKSCSSFAVGKGTCLLYSSTLNNNFEAESDSPYVFYDASCPYGSASATPTPSTSSEVIVSSTEIQSTTEAPSSSTVVETSASSTPASEASSTTSSLVVEVSSSTSLLPSSTASTATPVISSSTAIVASSFASSVSSTSVASTEASSSASSSVARSVSSNSVASTVSSVASSTESSIGSSTPGSSTASSVLSSASSALSTVVSTTSTLSSVSSTAISSTPSVTSSASSSVVPSAAPSTESSTTVSTFSSTSSPVSTSTPPTSVFSTSSSASSSSIPTSSATADIRGTFDYVDGDAAFHWGMYGATAQGSILKASYYDVSGDQFYYQTTATVADLQSGLDNQGYFYHGPSGLCLTLEQTSATAPKYNNAKITLQPCSSSATPPENQRWFSDHYDPVLLAYCVGLTADTGEVYGWDGNAYDPDTPGPQNALAKTVSVGGTCFEFTAA